MSLRFNAMACKKGENPNHPPKGSTIHVEPIREKTAIKRIKKMLRDHPRDLCLFTLGINTAFRANELLALTVNQVEHLGQGDVLAMWLLPCLLRISAYNRGLLETRVSTIARTPHAGVTLFNRQDIELPISNKLLPLCPLKMAVLS
jgi:hypothetical protein